MGADLGAHLAQAGIAHSHWTTYCVPSRNSHPRSIWHKE
ncbi:hypothetical protein BRADI_2g52993v3 [Brachypodium distachyon]|uniref:Uncharacterized protein n=1 Tax=Brachypodium distachyon TaxID=15368 RepID=A0A2K2DFK6_BRADI|nr:hypothetical protein BRADI_2g52993v3 [Brachypodium distachyon]